VKIDERSILIGDHIKVGKEARYMPAVKKLHQDSENVGKSEYIFGHQFGMIGILAEGPTTQCVPLNIDLHDGIDEIKALKNDSSRQVTVIEVGGSEVDLTPKEFDRLLLLSNHPKHVFQGISSFTKFGIRTAMLILQSSRRW